MSDVAPPPRFPDVVVPAEFVDGQQALRIISAVTGRMWEQAVPVDDMEVFCSEVTAATDPAAVARAWVQVR